MLGTPSGAHCQEKMRRHWLSELRASRHMGMELDESQRGNLAAPPCDTLVFAWRRFNRSARIVHRVCGVT